MAIRRSAPVLMGLLALTIGACVPGPSGGTTTTTSAPASSTTTTRPPTSTTTTTTTRPTSTTTTTRPTSTTTTTVPTFPMTRAQMLTFATNTLHELFDRTTWAAELSEVTVAIVDLADGDGLAHCTDPRRIEFSPSLFDTAESLAGYAPGVLAHEFGHIVGCNREGRFVDWAPPSFWDAFERISSRAPAEHFADCFALSMVPTYPADELGDYGCPSQAWADRAYREASIPRN